MMADGSEGTDVSPESEAAAAAADGEIWGTLEELLLACAVTRHGTASWDSVATEVQTRSPLAARPGLTPDSCRLRFRDLHRRFSTVGGSGGEGEEVEEREEDPATSAAEGWVGELRRLRVAELRRDVERCDLSIGTLQSKVKRLREERERSVSGEAKPDEVSGNDRLSGDEPGRSCRESNSTDLKPPKHPGGKGVKEEEVAKQEASGESAASSKESSDVRSSASLCRRRREGKASGTDEEEAASAPRRPPAQSSPPLAALLDAVAAKLGSLLDERIHEHESQEGAAYRDTIRRHVALETVRGKLKASAGSRAGDDDHYPAPEFYRDLLLLCTNLVVFLPRSGPDHAAAAEARALVSEHASAVLREPKQEHVPVPAAALGPAPTPAGADIVGPLIEEGKPLIVCRKRSSIAKAVAAVRKEEEGAEKGEAEKEEEEEEIEDEKKAVAAAATKDKAWGMRTKKGRGGLKNVAATKRAGADDTAAAEDAKKADKKSGAGGDAAAGGLAKKRNAVDFLKRLNQGSSPSRKRGSPLGTTRRRSAVAAEQQKTRKRGAGRMEGAGRGGSKRGGKAGGTKRGVGRPLKRGPGPTTPPPSKRAKTSRSEKPSTTSKRGGRRQVG